MGESAWFTSYASYRRGVAILIRKGLELQIDHTVKSNDGRVIVFRSVHDSKPYLFVNVYAPAKKSKKEIFYKFLVRFIDKVKQHGDTVIAGGDWNCVQIQNLDTRGISYVYLPKCNFKKFIR